MSAKYRAVKTTTIAGVSLENQEIERNERASEKERKSGNQEKQKQ